LSSSRKDTKNVHLIAEDDARLEVKTIAYPGETGDIQAHIARPKDTGKHAGVIVIHENRGLQPHIQEVTRRIAVEGFVAMAPDALSPLGGTPNSVDEARSLMRQLDNQATIKNYVAAVKYLKTHPKSTGKVGCVGFCWGGGMTNQVATNTPDLQAAVPFYGRQPAEESVPRIQAAVQLHYAGLDERINMGISAFEAALNKAAVEYQLFMYEGAEHAFFNDTGSRYHPEAAHLAWERMIAFFKQKLRI
jgi:carboxymethylenebutenolidase